MHEVTKAYVPNALIASKPDDKKYLVLHPSKPLRCILVSEQHPDESPSWSGFWVDSVYQVKWFRKLWEVEIDIELAGRKKLQFEFLNRELAECWVSDFTALAKDLFDDEST